MKKFLSILLVVLMALSCSVCAYCEEEDSDLIPLEGLAADLLDVSDLSASEWFESSEARALLTVLIALGIQDELGEEMFSISTTLFETSYVAKSEFSLIVYLHGEENDVMVFYAPAFGTLCYTMQDKTQDALVLMGLKTTAEEGCYENDLEDIVDAVSGLADAFGD